MTTPTASTDHRGTVSIQPPARRGHDTRMDKRFLVCGLMMSLAAMLLGVLVHGGLLRADYLAHAALYRDPAEANARLAALGVRIVVNGHAAYFAAIKATYDCLREQRQVDALDLNASQLSVKYSTADEYVVWAEEYMQVKE